MEQKNIKLGIIVTASLVVVIVTFYLIGKKEHLWRSGFLISARFSSLDGLEKGGGVLYAGMPAGSVEDIQLLDDTTISVEMLIDKKIGLYIRKNVVASIGSQGLMGSKVVNLTPVPGNSPGLQAGDIIGADKSGGLERILPKLSRISDNVEVLSTVLKRNILALDSSKLMHFLQDGKTAEELSAMNLYLLTSAKNLGALTAKADNIISDVRNGKGTIGAMMYDTSFRARTYSVLRNLSDASVKVSDASTKINQLTTLLKTDFSDRNSIAGVLLSDTGSAGDLRATLKNVRNGTEAFNQNMEALRHNFFLRGYFRKKQKDSIQQKMQLANKSK